MLEGCTVECVSYSSAFKAPIPSPICTKMKSHKLCGLKQCKFIILQLLWLEIQSGSYWTKIKWLQGLHSFWEPQRRICVPAFSSF